MPYIITTSRKYHPLAADSTENIHYKRRAVATLEEAREAVEHRVIDVVGEAYPDHTRGALSESGGTVGPLPDGTVIEVARVSYDALAGRVFDRDDYAPYFETDILAAFNAKTVR